MTTSTVPDCDREPADGLIALPGALVPNTVQHARQIVQAACADPRLGFVDDRGLLDALEQTQRLIAQTQALAAVLMAEADERQSADRIAKLSTAHWLHLTTNGAALRVLRGQVRHARQICADYPAVIAAQGRGDISNDQARAIVEALRLLPEDISREDSDDAITELLSQAGQFDPRGLAVLGDRLVEVIAPDRAEELLGEQLEKERRRAERDRHLGLYPDYHGSWIIKGKLPNAVGEQLSAILEALVTQRCTATRDAATHGDGAVGTVLERHQARADALADIITAYAATGAAPTHGGDRPRVNVTITLDDLLARLGHGSTDTGVDLPADEVRRMACDAEVIPVVLNSQGVPLDVGRAHRLVTPTLRAALTLRDKGCAFPGCDRLPRECEAHHIMPWLINGPTALANLVLLCPSHHARCEPATNPHTGQVIENPHRWEVRLDPHGLPEFLPPRTLDRTRTPRIHARVRLAQWQHQRTER